MMRLFLVSICMGLCSSWAQVVGQESQTATNVAAPVGSDAVANESLQELGKVIQQYIDDDKAVGAELLVIQDGQTLFHESFGYSDREQKRRWENETLCNIRSMTKPITSVAAQILIDRELLQLDVPVANYLESFDNEKSKSITVRQVIDASIGAAADELARTSISMRVWPNKSQRPGRRGLSLNRIASSGTAILARMSSAALVEKVSGEPLHEFVQTRNFRSARHDKYDLRDRSRRPAADTGRQLVCQGPAGWFRFWKPKKPLYPFAWGSQTVYSTTTDYAKFLRMIMDGGRVVERQLLSTAAVDRMLEPVSPMKRLGSDRRVPHRIP